MIGWLAYADAYDGRIVNGGQSLTNVPAPTENPWCGYDWIATLTTMADKIEAVKKGALYPYLRDLNIYRCPEAQRNMHRTYSIIESMNGMWSSPSRPEKGAVIKATSQIRRTSQRIVFIEEGYPSPDSFIVWYGREQWLDVPQCPHIKGSNFGFADGHGEYWRWEDERTLKWCGLDWSLVVGSAIPEAERTAAAVNNKDYQKLYYATWGESIRTGP